MDINKVKHCVIKTFKISLIVLLCFLFSSFLCSCNRKQYGTTTSNNTSSENYMHKTISIGNEERTYSVYIHQNNTPQPSMPLVIVLHGLGETGDDMRELTLRGFDKLADKENFIVVYPDGFDKMWNDGPDVYNIAGKKTNINDVTFISSLIDEMYSQYKIDKKRVYVTGISNGGEFTHLLAFKLTDKITAIAPLAGYMVNNLVDNNKPSSPIPVLMIHGTDDKLVPWDGKEFKSEKLSGRDVLPFEETVKYWVNFDGCSTSNKTSVVIDSSSSDGTKIIQDTYSGGKNGTEVVSYKIDGGGHTWPGGLQYLPENRIGKTSKDMDACSVIWEFFKKFSK